MITRNCSISGCTNRYYAKGYCSKHYVRTRVHGDAEDREGHHVPIEVKFWKKVDKNGQSVTPVGTPFWLWTGYAPKGYGSIWLNGRNERAHRVAWMMANGPIPEGLLVLHKCDTTRCVNVEHLFLGTDVDNIHDCIIKNRRVIGDHRGEKSGKAKLTDHYVRTIRADKRPHKQVAKEYGVDPSTICDIRNRKTWAHVA